MRGVLFHIVEIDLWLFLNHWGKLLLLIHFLDFLQLNRGVAFWDILYLFLLFFVEVN